MENKSYKKIFWGIFFLTAAIIAVAMFTFGTIFVFVPIADLICSNPYTKMFAVFVVILLVFLLFTSIKKR